MQSISPFNLSKVKYFEVINNTVELSEEERNLLSQNGFLVSDRLEFSSFKRAYAWIYWKDLPVIVTTDSILHAVHKQYSSMIKEVEALIIKSELTLLLETVRTYFRAQYADHLDTTPISTDDNLLNLLEDLDFYLSMAISLIKEDSQPPANSKIARHLAHIKNVNLTGHGTKSHVRDDKEQPGDFAENQVGAITLFGSNRPIDYTLFKIRGHYDESRALEQYFLAMTWLQLIDFHFVTDGSKPTLHRDQIVAAYILYHAIKNASMRDTWNNVEKLISTFVGWSDHISLGGLEQFFEDAGITTLDECTQADEILLLELLLNNHYGHQQFQSTATTNDAPRISFALFGGRYTIESDIIQNLMLNTEIDENKHLRSFPSPLDVMFVLGNSHALSHLEDELDQYGYRDKLNQLQTWVQSHSNEFWENTFYNHWLNAIRALNKNTTGDEYSSVMRTSAWADKNLHTQIGGWTQLRHDNILYAKPPTEIGMICDYPVGYVEPYPDFYASGKRFADFGNQIFKQYRPSRGNPNIHYINSSITKFQQRFKHLADVCETLETLSHKELNREALTEEDIIFLRSIVVRKYIGEAEYGGITPESWDGWYTELIPSLDRDQQLVTDIYTNYDNESGQAGVLHLGTDFPKLLLFIVDDGEETAMYAGVSFSVFEHLESGLPPRRLTNKDWALFLQHQRTFLHESREERYQEEKTSLDELIRWCLEYTNGSDTEKAFFEKKFRTELEESPAAKIFEEFVEKEFNRTMAGLKSGSLLEKLRSEMKELEREHNEMPLSIPAWAQSFRHPSTDKTYLRLPDAFNTFKENLSEELFALLGLILEVIHLSQYSEDRHYKMSEIVQFVKEYPEEIQEIEGMTDTLYQEFIDVLRRLHYLDVQ